jgi:hypothetical protein
LDDVPYGQEFWTCSGVILHNIHDLITYLQACNEREYAYHVNLDRDKNDFANWVRDTLHDEVLAKNLSNYLRREEYLERIKSRVTELLTWERTDQIRHLASA